MDSNECSDRKEKDDSLSQLSEELNFTMLNEDCKRQIFSFLDWTDLINLADTCKQLSAAVCCIFQQKIRNAKIDIGHYKYDSFSVWRRIEYPDIFISTRMMALKFLRIFGHLIDNLHIDFYMFNREQYKIVVNYLAKYGSDSFIELSLQNGQLYSFPEHFPRIPFTKVRILQIEQSYFDRDIPISSFFPNVQTLKLGRNMYQYTSAVRMCVRSVKHLFFDSVILLTSLKFATDDVLELLKMNPQLEELDLQLISLYDTSISPWDSKMIHSLNDILPNLKRLKLNVPFKLIFQNKLTPIHFDHIEYFSYASSVEYIPFSFSKLKYLELQSKIIGLIHPPVRDLIDKNEYLTSISIQCPELNYVESLFLLKNVLSNIQEINIGLIANVSWECVLRFLKLNRSLKKFSMIGTTNTFYAFAYRIAENSTSKIRNRILEFVIERDSDDLSTKYAIRHLNWEVHGNNSLVKKHLMQLCTYAELSSTTAQENYDYIVSVRRMIHRYKKQGYTYMYNLNNIEYERKIKMPTQGSAITNVIIK